MKTKNKVKTKSKDEFKDLTRKELISELKRLKGVIKFSDLAMDSHYIFSPLTAIEKSIEGLKGDINNVGLKLRSFINQHTSQIRVLEKDGKWGGYTGVFHLDPKDNKERAIEKAMNHYNSYYKGVDFYKNRTLGLFITSHKERKLIKVLQDNQKKFKKNSINNND